MQTATQNTPTEIEKSADQPKFRPKTTAPNMSNYGYAEAGASWKKKAMRSFNAASSSPQWDIDHSNDTLRQRARMLYMAAPIATSAIKINRTNVIGCGLRLKSSIDIKRLGISKEAAKEWQDKTEAEFKLWAEKKKACDAHTLQHNLMVVTKQNPLLILSEEKHLIDKVKKTIGNVRSG